jgi:iron donor protein CyaY
VTDQEFQKRSDEAITLLYNIVSEAADDNDGFEADFNGGALVIEFEDPPAKFVVSPNSPVRQIWVSAHSKSFKFDWDDASDSFVLGNETLVQMMEGAISKQLGKSVEL